MVRHAVRLWPNSIRPYAFAIGTPAVETFFTKREQFHSAIINEHVSLLEPATRNRLADLQQYFMSHGFPDPAGGAAPRHHRRRPDDPRPSHGMGYADSFALLGVVLIIAILPVALLRKGTASGGTRQ